MSVVAYGGGVYIADKSAWERARLPALAGEWEQALQNGQIVTCAVTRMELLFSTRTIAKFQAWSEALAAIRDIPVTRTIWASALAGMEALATHSDAYHRLPMPDYLIAAAAEDAGQGVLHYDNHFDRLQQVFAFESHWIAPAGSVP